MRHNEGLIYRSQTLSIREFDKDTREFTFVGSTEYEAKRWGITEILSHDKGHIRLDRARNVASILLNHDSRTIAAAILSVDIVDGETVVKGRFTTTQRGKDAMTEVDEAALKGISVGYQVHAWEVDEDEDIYRAVDWEPYEFSLTPIPVDPNSGIGRSSEEDKQIFFESINRSIQPKQEAPKMSDEQTPATVPAPPEGQRSAETHSTDVDIPNPPPAPAQPTPESQANTSSRDDAIQIARHAENLGLRASDYMGMPRADAQAKMLQDVAAQRSTDPVQTSPVEVAADALDRRAEHFAGKLREMPSLGVLEQLARANGETVDDRKDLIMRMLNKGKYIHQRALETVASLGNVTILASDKAIIKGFDSYKPVFDRIASVRRVSDFKTVHSAGLTFGAFNTPGEGNALNDLTADDFGDTGSIEFKGGILQLTEEALWNDELDLWFKGMRRLGFRARREEDKVLIATLEAATFSGGSLGSAAFGLAGIKTSWTDFNAITDASGELLGVDPEFILLPSELYITGLEETTKASGETTARIFAESEVALSPVNGRGLSDANDWYLFANPEEANGLELLKHIAYNNPALEEIDAGAVIARKFKIKYPLGGMINNYKTGAPAGIYKNVVV